ncbi:MAG: ROK family transcriptional regulator [Pseudomonadota bacterium]|nr:ROK family transcriptional regulator [Pseudomonadota bacterium]
MLRDELRSLLDDADADHAEARVVRVLSERGAVSANELARATGLARSTISQALAELRKARVIVEAPAADAARGVGRPAASFALNPRAGACIGLHLSLDELKLTAADVSHSVIFEKTVPLGRDYAPAVAVEAARRTLRESCREAGVAWGAVIGVGVAFSGPVAPDGRVQRASIIPTWAGVNLREAFEPALERPIFADNESNCSAIAEMTWGAAVGVEDFVLFKIDIGVGGAIVANGRVLTGVAGAGGEFGHMTLDPHGDLCRCGNRGCLELTASLNPAVAIASRLAGREVGVDEFVEAAARGDVGFRRLLADTAEIAGRGLGMIGAILNPGLILIGGRAALAGDALLAPLIASYERHTLIKREETPEAHRVRIEIAKFPRNHALLGAVALVMRRRGRLI